MGAIVAGLASGVLFGLGLALSGMTQPAKVIGFLDVAGDWDPSLGLVMAGAIGFYAPAYRLVERLRAAPVFAAAYALPTSTRIDRSLLAGATLFGAGWGLAGFCPGPGIVAAGTGQVPGLVFVLAMIMGMLLHAVITRSREAIGTATEVAPTGTSTEGS